MTSLTNPDNCILRGFEFSDPKPHEESDHDPDEREDDEQVGTQKPSQAPGLASALTPILWHHFDFCAWVASNIEERNNENNNKANSLFIITNLRK